MMKLCLKKVVTMKAVSENIRRYREAAHLSAQDLASRITVTEKNVEGWECGALQPDLETLKLIASALDVDIMDLFYGKYRSEDFLHERPRRIRISVLLASIFIACLATFFLLFHAGIPPRQPDVLYHTVMAPAVYASGAAALASFWAIWYDFRVSSQSLRECLISLGIICIIAYYIDLLLQYMPKYHYQALFSLYKHPLIFILPGTLFFLGCNTKSE